MASIFGRRGGRDEDAICIRWGGGFVPNLFLLFDASPPLFSPVDFGGVKKYVHTYCRYRTYSNE